MSKINPPRNDGFLDGNSVRQDWFRAITDSFKRLNAAADTATLDTDGITISNPPTQAEVQALAAKLDAVINSLK